MPSPTGIHCRGVVKEFGSGETKIRVLHGVDLDVAEGEVTFLVGPSGCGKTTLITILAGLLTPEAGTTSLFGTELHRLRNHEVIGFRGQNIGFIFQQFNLLPALTASENAAVPLLVQGVPQREAVARADALLDKLGMGPHLEKLPAMLSGGQQQRVAIARALVHEPRLVICDEPTASLDAHTGQTVMSLMRDIALRPDRAVIVVTHDNRIFPFADRIIHMSDGRVTDVELPPFAEVH